MANYTYRGYDKTGAKAVGCLAAADQAAAQTAAAALGVNEAEVFASATAYSRKGYKLVGPRELSLFCRQMSIMFVSQVTLMEGVQLLGEQTENKQLKACLTEIYDHMERGYTLAETMGMYPNIFGGYLLSMVTIGEMSGTLDSVFMRMSEYYDKENKTRKKLRAAVTYPAILTVLMSAIVVLLIVEVLPMFSDILRNMGSDLSPTTRWILNAGNAVSSYILIIVAVIAVLIAALYAYTRTASGSFRLDTLKLRIPISRFLTTRILTARFSRCLSILIKSGVQLLNAMEECRRIIDNKYVAKRFDDAVERLRDGGQLAEVLKGVGVFPPLFLKMAYIGQTAGQLDEMLDKSASVFDEDVDDAIERLTVMIEPILIIVLSVIVGLILVSVMVPMIDIMKTIG